MLAGTVDTGFDFMVYTGDLVSHDPDNELSREYILYTETVLYDLFKRIAGSGPVYPALGNHDTHNEYAFSLRSWFFVFLVFLSLIVCVLRIV